MQWLLHYESVLLVHKNFYSNNSMDIVLYLLDKKWIKDQKKKYSVI